ncbi:hypothetical protein [Rhizobium sp. BK176]|uniref:hypothetical protein n=1 Tax=Rhizobium sp. BK176 TaxID=2587071 RepID=UPI0021675B63|nr:hypothetical protein [Rhizobium sp. BK176]MCS4089136.1 hypothetical protein [Rhizobium sp. BK176]
MTLLATQGDTFMITIGEYSDVLLYGPFIAKVSIELETAMESFGEWLHENGDEGAEKLLEDTLCTSQFENHGPGAEKIYLRSAAFAAWLVHVGAVDVQPAVKSITLNIHQYESGGLTSMVGIGGKVHRTDFGSAPVVVSSPRRGP